MSGGNRLVLTQCWRSDVRLFDFYSSLIVGGSRFTETLPVVLEAAKREFHFEGPARWNLVISHRKRVQLNALLNLSLKPLEGALYIPVKRKRPGSLAQSMWIWPGIQLLGCVCEKKGVRNQVLYTVEELTTNCCKLSGGISLTHEQVSEWTVLSFAQTYASCQGTEFEGTLRLHDITHKFFTKRHLFVGLSRAKSSASVDLKE